MILDRWGAVATVDTIGFESTVRISTATYKAESCSINDCQPIPLTEEWLLKFGFVDKNYTLELKAKRKTIVFNWFSKVVSTGKRSGYYSRKYRHIKYVHQLQNLYFALTGEELEVKNG